MDILGFWLCSTVLTIASISDLRTREIPDWLSYSFIAFGLGLAVIKSSVFLNFSPIIESLTGFIAGLAIGWAMFYLGQWGGGDSKLMMGLGATLGLSFQFPLDFFASFLMNLIVTGAFYGLFAAFLIGAIHWRKVASEMKVHLKKSRFWRIPLTLISIAGVASSYIFLPYPEKYIGALIFLFLGSSTYLWAIIKAIEEGVMKKWISADKVTEGDWIVQDIMVGKKRISGPKDLGISKEQLIELKKLYNQRKVKKVLIKEGIPFVPSFLIAFIITHYFGNLFSYFIGF